MQFDGFDAFPTLRVDINYIDFPEHDDFTISFPGQEFSLRQVFEYV